MAKKSGPSEEKALHRHFEYVKNVERQDLQMGGLYLVGPARGSWDPPGPNLAGLYKVETEQLIWLLDILNEVGGS